jgi:YjbR
VTDYADVAPEVLHELRSVCLGLPQAYEEPAWAGTRWRIRKRTFAHVVAVEDGSPPAYARASGSAGPVTVLTFRSSGPELDALSNAGHPFFRPPWAPNVVGMVLDEGVDWNEVAELLTESYCVMAPKNLIAQVDRPSD